MVEAKIGIIGGSGLYRMAALQGATEHRLETPYGRPSDSLVQGEIAGVPVVFLARHGQGHRLIPSEVPYRANMHALRRMGVRYLISFSAVGSLREHIAPTDMVLPDQFIDMTRNRASTFFGDGAVAHVSMAEPVCPNLCELVAQSVAIADREMPVRLHRGGTYVCIEGPQFSSLAESRWYRSLGADVIGMTNMPEAKLAREAQIAYASLAMVTDYDCWHPREAHVTADAAIANLMKNADRAQRIAADLVARIAAANPPSPAHTALDSALVTPWNQMPAQTLSRLSVLAERRDRT